jgi:hypothetical protein
VACDHSEGAKHDCAYVDWRNGFIDEAIALASKQYPEPDNATATEHKTWSVKWDAAYHRAMKTLTFRAVA